MTRMLRAALTQTRNAYQHMPASVDELSLLAERTNDIREANIAHHRELVASAAALGVQALCMGELCMAPYFALGKDPMWLQMAEDARTGPSVLAMQEAARAANMLLVVPIYELDADSGERFNTAVVIEANGEVIGKYRKTHIPEGTNDAGSFHETFYYGRSDGRLGDMPKNISQKPFFPVFATSVGRIGIATCYDRHFPGCMKALAEEGAELVFSPAITFGAKSQRMWELEFPVDACRHHIFIGGSNRIGSEKPWGQEFFGGSYFVGPNGRCEQIEARPELIVADLDLDELSADDPSGWDFRRDLRPEIY